MNELLTKESIDIFDALLPSMTEVYVREFAKAPWNEVSRCPDDVCGVDFTPRPVGDTCDGCASILVDAYDKTLLSERWRELLLAGGLAEVEYAKDCLHPSYACATE